MDGIAALTGDVAAATASADGAAMRTLQLRRGEASHETLSKLKELGKSFDAVFANTMLGELMKPAVGAGLGGSGPGASIVQGIIEQNLAEHLGKAGGFGIGRMIEKALKPLLAIEPVDAGELEKNQGFRKADDGSGGATKAPCTIAKSQGGAK